MEKSMPDLILRSHWTINLTTEEFRLIMRALGGRLNEDEIEIAKQLGDDLTKLRSKQMKTQVEISERLWRDATQP